MRKIARASGGDTDTSKNFEYADWPALDRFVGEPTDVPPLGAISRASIPSTISIQVSPYSSS